jgi:hypothetical protein
LWHPGSEETGTPRIPVPGTSPLEYGTVGIEQISFITMNTVTKVQGFHRHGDTTPAQRISMLTADRPEGAK